MIVIVALLPNIAAALAPTLLYLWQAQNPGESDGANWWFWLVLLLLLILLVWWLLGRKAPESVASASETTLPPVDPHPAEDHLAIPAAPVVTLDPEPPATPVLTAAAAPPSFTGTPDNLTKIEGIGPKINELLHGAGIHTFAELAQADVGRLREILLQAGLRVNDPTTWPDQAALAAAGKWEELQSYQTQLAAGRRRA